MADNDHKDIEEFIKEAVSGMTFKTKQQGKKYRNRLRKKLVVIKSHVI